MSPQPSGIEQRPNGKNVSSNRKLQVLQQMKNAKISFWEDLIIILSVRTWRCRADLSVFVPSHPMSMRMRFANWFQVVRLLWSWIWIIALLLHTIAKDKVFALSS